MVTAPSPLQGQRIFISYPRGGLAHTWAEEAQADLQQRGATPWRDETDLRPGNSNWYDSIEAALRQADAVVCVVGAESEACRWQKREMLLADDLGLPVALRDQPECWACRSSCRRPTPSALPDGPSAQPAGRSATEPVGGSGGAIA